MQRNPVKMLMITTVRNFTDEEAEMPVHLFFHHSMPYLMRSFNYCSYRTVEQAKVNYLSSAIKWKKIMKEVTKIQ